MLTAIGVFFYVGFAIVAGILDTPEAAIRLAIPSWRLP
jgi:hypothetical protein